MLNRLWLGFFISAFLAALWQWGTTGSGAVFNQLVQACFDMSKVSFDIALGLVGVLAFWMGMLRLAEQSGLMQGLAYVLAPLFKRLMPEVPAGHPAIGHISMNLGANMLGLDNAATPVGLKAMQSLQSLNPNPDTASNAQILFLVLNTSSVTVFPVTILMYRAQQGSVEASAVFLPILLATLMSTLVGLLAVAFIQRLKLWQPVVLGYFVILGLCIAALVGYLVSLPPEQLAAESALIGNLLLFSTIILILCLASYKRVNVYEQFIEGAKEGFQLAISILPYLLAMLVAIGVFRASGLLEALLNGVRYVFQLLGWDTQFVEALPTALMKPLSGSGARAMMLETMQTYGVDSFAARVAATVQGSTETTFYVLAVYFGSVGIKRVRHAVACGLLADLAGITSAILLCYWFFG